MQAGPPNEINLTGNIWLAADIHLGAEIPLTAKEFYRFLAMARTQADNLILCGDIFDSWIGDDNALKKPSQWLQLALDQLQQTAATINLFLMPGNRDFLIGTDLVNYLGANLIESPSLLINNNKLQILIAHGDEYCIDDIAYQRFRKFVHNPLTQKLFLLLPLSLRRNIAAYARKKSKKSRRHKAADIMDVNQSAIQQALITANTNIMIHGHTHRPDIHNFSLNAQAASRYVLPDWEFDHAKRGGWLSLDNGILKMHYLGTGHSQIS